MTSLPRQFRAMLALPVLLGGAACADSDPIAQVAGASDRGQQLIQEYGCDSCHAIPGIPGANGRVGPPLYRMARRAYIAGVLPNTPDNMMLFIREPEAVDPRTAMPDMGVSASDARDITAYLYTLK